jgi:hypothetical protein
MDEGKLKRKVLENKAWSAVGVFLLLMALGVVGLFLNSANMGLQSHSTAESLDYRGGAADIGIPLGGDSSSGSYVEVQEGSMQIESEDVEQDTEEIRGLAENYDGWIESSTKSHGEIYTTADLTVKVDSEDFQSFVSDMKNDFEVESYSVQDYRLYTQRERDELDILNETMMEYESIRREVNEMDNSAEKLDLLMQITEKQLEVQEKRNRYSQDLADKRQRGDYATLNVELREKRKIDLVPDDLGQRFRNEVNEMVDNVANTLITTLTGGVEIFFAAIKYLIYLAIVVLPAYVAYRIGRRLYEKMQ